MLKRLQKYERTQPHHMRGLPLEDTGSPSLIADVFYGALVGFLLAYTIFVFA